jgi:transcriptional regulator with XRE-family HTH domain
MLLTDTPEGIGARLRWVRQSRGLSLAGVEAASAGTWRAAVVGSYERGDRTLTVPRLIGLAEFYGIPVWRLFPGSEALASSQSMGRITIDLAALDALPMSEAGPIARFALAIIRRRGDYYGRVLSLRGDDVLALATLYDESPSQLRDRFHALGLIQDGDLLAEDGDQQIEDTPVEDGLVEEVS